MVTKLHQNDTTSCYRKRYGKRYVGDSDKRYRYDTETIEYFLPGTNHVESMWARAKLRNKKECGTHKTLLTSYLLEFMWRQQYGKDPFQNLLEHMRNIYVV